MVQINGVQTLCDDCTLTEYLSGTNYDITRIAVEKNGNIVPKAQYAGTMLQDGDTVEIVSFVGGG